MNRISILFFIGFAASFSAGSAMAQTKNTTVEDFDLGTQLVFQTCESKGISVLPTGKNMIWDYSSLNKIENDTTIENMVDSKQTPYGNLFPNANLVEKYSTGKYVFLHKTTGQTYLLGYIDSANAMNANYEKPVLIAQRPMAFGDSVKDVFKTAYTIQKLNFKGSGMVTIAADGYGKLLLPNGEFENVIRLKITQSQNDTLIQYSSLNATLITTYVWFDNLHKSALLKITDVESGNYAKKTVEYLIKETEQK